MMEWFVIIGYGAALFMVCLFSLEQLYLAWVYRKNVSPGDSNYAPITKHPKVTVQLPVYNERYVVERLIESVCKLDYPKDQLEIQVLDDSTDETRSLVERQVSLWQGKGINIQHVLRDERTGYKAGALAHGLSLATGEFIAIFDSDFMPHPDFLEKTLAAFDSSIGMVQTRWDHLNQDYSFLTEIQAFGLNAHFTVEQRGRNTSGKLMNFNGTAGVWRKKCIEDAGGWQYDTLTEDLDLSYRAQLKGWKFKYLEDVLAPAELPVLVPAIKSQQYRWNKGAAETARKNIGTILRSGLSIHQKIHAVFHLLNSSVFMFLLIGAILSIPMLHIKETRPDLALLFNLASAFIIGFIAMMAFYWISTKAANPNASFKYYIVYFPLFLILSMGMALHNTIAVVEGYLGIKTPFVRTPKFNIQSKSDTWKGNIYLRSVFTPITLLEGLLATYFLFGIAYGVILGDYGLILFHFMLTVGFGAVFFLSVTPVGYAKTKL